MSEPSAVLVENLTDSDDGVFGYTVVAYRDNPETYTELDRFTGHVTDWSLLKEQANEKAAFYAKAFGITCYT